MIYVISHKITKKNKLLKTINPKVNIKSNLQYYYIDTCYKFDKK